MKVGELAPGATFTHCGVEYTVVDHCSGRVPTGSLTRLTFIRQPGGDHDELTMNSDQLICLTPPIKSP